MGVATLGSTKSSENLMLKALGVILDQLRVECIANKNLHS